MAWSTSQLAGIAGVSARSIRHWHDVGLLPRPERLSNGYKQYTPQHLVLVLRIARLGSLGFSLEEVGRMLDSEAAGLDSLRGLRVELAARIAELQQVLAEVDELVRLGVAPDVSHQALLAMDALGHDAVGRNVAIVLAHLTPEEDTAAFAAAVHDAPGELRALDIVIRDLPADASEREIAALADRSVRAISEFAAANPRLFGGVQREWADADAAVLNAVATDSMNPAQRRVMRLVVERLSSVLRDLPQVGPQGLEP